MNKTRQIAPIVLLVLAATLFCLISPPTHAVPLLYEGFDVATGPLHGKAGATSFGFDPVLGTFWDKGIFDDPEVGAGSIAAPASTASFYTASPVGNRVIEDFQSTVAGRTADVNSPHLFGTFLALLDLDPGTQPAVRASVHFTNFSVFAENMGAGSTWNVQTSGGTTDTGINVDTTTLISWELEFDQANSLNFDLLRVWFNNNPLSDPADFEITTADLGQNVLGGLTLTNDIFLGLSTVEFDEFRIGSDWVSVGIVPEPSTMVLASVVLVAGGLRIRRHNRYLVRLE